MRKSSIFLYVVVSLCTACGAVRYPVPAELATVAPLRVNGRQGVLVHERLSFGPYATGEVSRSSTRGTDVTDVLDSHGAEYRQRYSFALAQGGSKVADVECTAEGSGAQTLSVTWRLKRVLSCRLTADRPLKLTDHSNRSDRNPASSRSITTRSTASEATTKSTS